MARAGAVRVDGDGPGTRGGPGPEETDPARGARHGGGRGAPAHGQALGSCTDWVWRKKFLGSYFFFACWSRG
ncbi:hypothetical protein SAVIM338S_07396 [Streptomyces avidinii]